MRTPLGLSFNAFDSERYVLTYENRELREIAAQAPYDAIMFMGNTRKYGGGGIFNLWATTSSDTSVSEYVFVHEFGHSFGGLADEYYTSPAAYAPTGIEVEPCEPNVTVTLDAGPQITPPATDTDPTFRTLEINDPVATFVSTTTVSHGHFS